jgi:hypothetical protein
MSTSFGRVLAALVTTSREDAAGGTRTAETFSAAVGVTAAHSERTPLARRLPTTGRVPVPCPESRL